MLSLHVWRHSVVLAAVEEAITQLEPPYSQEKVPGSMHRSREQKYIVAYV